MLHVFALFLPPKHPTLELNLTAAPVSLVLWVSCLAWQVRRSARIQRKYVKTMQFHPIIVRFSYVNSAASDVSGRRAGLRTVATNLCAQVWPFTAARREGEVDCVCRNVWRGQRRHLPQVSRKAPARGKYLQRNIEPLLSTTGQKSACSK